MVETSQTPRIGEKVKITKAVSAGAVSAFLEVRGEVVAEEDVVVESSSFSGAEGNVFWVKRLLLEKDDGELSAIVVDEYTKLEQC